MKQPSSPSPPFFEPDYLYYYYYYYYHYFEEKIEEEEEEEEEEKEESVESVENVESVWGEGTYQKYTRDKISRKSLVFDYIIYTLYTRFLRHSQTKICLNCLL